MPVSLFICQSVGINALETYERTKLNIKSEIRLRNYGPLRKKLVIIISMYISVFFFAHLLERKREGKEKRTNTCVETMVVLLTLLSVVVT